MVQIKLGQSAIEYLGIDRQDISDICDLSDERGGYWTTVEAFVSKLLDMHATELTFKQTNWAVEVKDRLDDMRRKGKL